MVASLHSNHIHLMNTMLGHLAQAPHPTLSVNSLCREWQTGRCMAQFLLDRHKLLEVGGPKKVRKGADFVIRGIDWPAPGVIPLWTLGFLT